MPAVLETHTFATRPSSSPAESRWSRLFAQAILIRAVEERLLALFAQGKLFGTVHTCIGQEWTGVAVAEHLQDGDFVFSNHRCHGHFLARNDDVDGLIAEVMGKQTGVCGGRGGSQHLCSNGFFSNGIQGGIAPVAAGLALAQKLRESDNLTVVFIGDGTLGEGAVYETLNVASKWNLPLLVVLENNLYSQSTSQRQTLAGSMTARAEAFAIKARKADTWNPLALTEIAGECVADIRRTSRPMFLQIDTYRLMAHSKGDDDRDPREVQSFRERDPITRYFHEEPELATQALAEANRRIDAAVALAEQAPFPELPTPMPPTTVPLNWRTASIVQSERSVTLIRNALHRALQSDGRIVLLGEDIESPYGGAFKATKGLSHEFPDRVRNTPISEALIVGLGNGLALARLRPVCEIMFGDFVTLAADQIINHASKFRYMYNDQVTVPLILRTPMGGRRGYGPTHSQSLEKHLLGLPDTRVLATNHRYDPGELYDRLVETIDRPTLVIENKVLYGQRVTDDAPAGFVLEQSEEPFPTVRIRPEGVPDVTVVCYGEMLREVETAILEAFDEHEIIAEVICPTQLYPLDLRAISESATRSGKLLIVEEGLGFAAFGAEVLARIHEQSPGAVKRSRRVSSPDLPIPACAPLEQQLLPNAAAIVAALVELMTHE